MKKILFMLLAILITIPANAATLTPAFGKWSSAGGSVDAGKQNINTMQVMGATFSKPGGKPTMTIQALPSIRPEDSPLFATNQTAALQWSLDNGAGKNVLWGGTYNITSLLQLNTSNMNLIGIPGTTQVNGSFGYGMLKFNAVSNVIIHGVTFNNTYSNATEDGTGVIYSSANTSLSNITLDKCVIHAPNANTSGVTWNVRFNSGDTATADGLNILNSEISNIGRIGINVFNRTAASDVYTAVQHVNIKNNKIVNTGLMGSYGIGITLDQFIYGFNISDNTITPSATLPNSLSIETLASQKGEIKNNRISSHMGIGGTGGIGTQTGWANGIEISGNKYIGIDTGFHYFYLDNSFVHDNDFSINCNSTTGILLKGSNNKVRSNRLVQTGNAGTFLQVLDATNAIDGSRIYSTGNVIEDFSVDASGSSASSFTPFALNSSFSTGPATVYNNSLTRLTFTLPSGGTLGSSGACSTGSPGAGNQPINNVVQASNITSNSFLSSTIATFNFASDADLTVGFASASDQSATTLIITDTHPYLTTSRNVILPTFVFSRFVVNSTSHILTIKTASGTGFQMAAGSTAVTVCDGSNILGVPAGPLVYPLGGPEGTNAAPTYSFASHTGSGMFDSGGVPCFSNNGTTGLCVYNSSLRIPANASVKDISTGNPIFQFTNVDATTNDANVNYLSIENNVSGSAPYFLAHGTDTDIDINFITKNNGAIKINSGSNLVYRCVGGTNDGAVNWKSGGPCSGGTNTATSLKIN